MFRNAGKHIAILILCLLGSNCQNWIGNKTNSYVELNFHSYQPIYNIIEDSLALYQKSSLQYYACIGDNRRQLDSMICLNSRADLLVSTINISTGIGNDAKTDASYYILGKKINKQWYFFLGSTLILPRDLYGKDQNSPLTMYELSQIARKELLESALIKKEGEYIVNDKWIDAHFYNNGYYRHPNPKVPGMVSSGEEFQMPKHKAFVDSVHWFYIMDKWNHKIDTNEYKPHHNAKPNL